MLVVGVGSANKTVVPDVKRVPNALYNAGDFIDVFFGRNAGLFGFFFNFLTVLVGAGLKVNVKPLHLFIARYHIGKNRIIGVAYMRLA